MVDLAREQSPTLDHLYQFAMVAQNSGYDALGLYLEHRFAYRSASWATGQGAITPDQIQRLRTEFPSLRIIPFINLLGHMEGFLYTDEGRSFRETPLAGLQACPLSAGFREFCEGLVDDILASFSDEIIHLGGDETSQLGTCARCKAWAENEPNGLIDLYANHFSHLAQRVIDAGRRPALWGDMALQHPSILNRIPHETIIFDWQYEEGVSKSAPQFPGFDVVACPTTAVYNAAWMHTERTESNIRTCARDVHELALYGFCLTSWEQILFTPIDSIFPAVEWAGRVIDTPSVSERLTDAYGDGADWARIMGKELESLGGIWAASGHRHKLKSRLLLSGNPFLAWFYHREVAPEKLEPLLKLLERARHTAPAEQFSNVTVAVRTMVECLQIMEAAHQEYCAGRPDGAISRLALARMAFDNLAKLARQNHHRIGSSLADFERAQFAKRWIEVCIQRIRDYGNRELGYLPAFEILTHPQFVPHDQACWWLVNRWARD